MQHPDRPVLARGRAVVGIDIGKNKHAAVAVDTQGQKLASLAAFANDRDGVDLLQTRVLESAGKPKAVLFAMEATGHYWMPLYHELVRRGYTGVVLNPIQTHGEARTRIRKTKTDKRDAEGIARFVLAGHARAARIPDEATLELRILTRHMLQLTRMKGDVERAAQSLSDRIFPEYDGCFSKPFLASGRALIRQIGLAPKQIAAEPDATRELLQRVSRGRLSDDAIYTLLRRAENSIGNASSFSSCVKGLSGGQVNASIAIAGVPPFRGSKGASGGTGGGAGRMNPPLFLNNTRARSKLHKKSKNFSSGKKKLA